MKASMAAYLRVVAPHLHPELIAPEALSHLQILAQTFPPCSLAGFECRLGIEQSRVDFLVKLPRHPLNLPEHFFTSPIWQAFREFYQEWTEPTSVLRQNVKSLGLEFDLVGQPSLVPIPCILLELNQESFSEDFSLIEILTGKSLSRLNYLPSLLLQSNLQRCVKSLPKGARLTNIGMMLSRPSQAVRVVVKEISPPQLLNYLVQIGWQDPTNTLSSVVLTLSEFVDSLAVSFDVGETIHPRIGLECHLDKQTQPDRRWQLFLDYLVERGLCTPGKQKSLLAWPGLSTQADQPELWPSNLTWGDRFLGSKALSIFWRTIHEVKIVYQPGHPLSAKAYLAFGHEWLDSSALIRREQQTTQACNQSSLLKNEETQADTSAYLEQVRRYYDRMNPLILKHVGNTYQTSLLKTDSTADPYCATNLYCAAQAGIQPGHRVLDAGCGAGGPSIDIARNIEGVAMDAITLSPAQAQTAKELVQQAGLADRIQVHIGDFHHLPFADEVFDVVLFLESAVYSYDRQQLFAEAYRVLRPGGSLYIKEPFSKELPLSDQQRQEIQAANRVYVCKIARLSESIQTISGVGFQNIRSRDLSEIFGTNVFSEAMIEYQHGLPLLSEFGKSHYYQFQYQSGFFGEIKACKPS